ncbi:MAG: hypothetical protein SFW09_00670 [Hyphomicrobiaceae bacterium]|nr:hypothetical protein [Hyphomicrobiaceae bacterium]
MEQSTTFTPNVQFRRLRRYYLCAVLTAVVLLFLALVTMVNNIGHGLLPAFLLAMAVLLLIFSMMVRGAARCPACSNSLMWRSGPFGTGRLSIGVKPKCPSCGLDLEQPYSPPTPSTEAPPAA